MALIQLHNTLSGKKEEFKPFKKTLFGTPKVGMYHCGPTVYNYPHIGNLRAYVFADTLKRLMLASGFKVQQVINITDVGHLVSDADTGEDKMEKARLREHKSAHEIAEFYTNVFFENLKDLNIDSTGTKFPRATDYIKEQIAIVATLEKKGFTYKTTDGIYFDTSKFPHYGKLGNIDIGGIREGERIGVNTEKKNPTDFALWKFSPVGSAEKREQEWPSPWGVGFPGWHIECSAMSKALLGETFDIHTGGIDHIPVHHNNEIAQSEGSTGKDFVHYWMHSAFMNIEGGKMAKSEGNFITLASVVEKGITPLAYRYFLLGARYSTPLNFTWEALEAGAQAYKRLTSALSELPTGGKVDKELAEQALSFIADDLDTPKTLALLWDILKHDSLSPADKKATIIKIDALLGLNLGKVLPKAKAVDLPAEILKLAEDRIFARTAKNWKKSDDLRLEIESLGYDVKDTPEGQQILKK
jgi:cysteinyl-tRNA synthetase